MKVAFTGKTPRELGYRMPAEWERHDAVWLAWPHDPTTFPNGVEKAEEAYTQMIEAIHEREAVNLFVKDKGMETLVVKRLREKDVDLDRINFFFSDYADVWFRDYGPIFVVNKDKKKLAMVHWIFNAWGGKYEELMKDAVIPSVINEKMRLDSFYPGIVLEGGSIDVNGKGTLLTTEQCLLNKNRNRHLGRTDINKYLMDYLGVDHIIWLGNGIMGDDTDGHIDDIARFVDTRTVLCAYEENESDENHNVLKENYEKLKQSRDQDGNSMKIGKLPMPGFVGDEKVGRLPASYANFYIGNEVVLVPIFGHENDREALRVIKKVFPKRDVVGINCKDLVYGLGTIHCVTQQQPAVD